MTVNIGIGQNRWLAKVGASFNKPNGMYVIDQDNLEVVYGFMELMDLPYIKQRNKLRLNMAGIYTPLDFLYAPEHVLTRQVFKSINGHHWYLKLRGYETEVDFGIKTVGRSYVLEHRTNDPKEIEALLFKASIKVARRLLRNGLSARGLMLSLKYAQTYGVVGDLEVTPRTWYERYMYASPAWRSDQIYERVLHLFHRSPPGLTLSGLVIISYGVKKHELDQLGLFTDESIRQDRLETAMNAVNDKYGELTLIPAMAAKSKNPMRDKIPFGTIRYFS